jgi:hypothetical protein
MIEILAWSILLVAVVCALWAIEVPLRKRKIARMNEIIKLNEENIARLKRLIERFDNV